MAKNVGASGVFKPVLATPFFHLSNEPFWKLMKSDCYVEKKEYSLGALRESFYGAKYLMIFINTWKNLQADKD